MNRIAHYIQIILIAQIDAFERFAVEKVLAAFANAEAEANEVANATFASLGSMYGEGDMGDMADIARDEGIAYYSTLTSVEQGFRNLIAAGVYHLFEQQKAAFQRLLEEDGRPKMALSSLPTSPKIAEAGLVANVVKHGEGPSAQKLRMYRPDLLVPPVLRGSPLGAHIVHQGVTQPIGGESLYIEERDIHDYAQAVRQLWQDIAKYGIDS